MAYILGISQTKYQKCPLIAATVKGGTMRTSRTLKKLSFFWKYQQNNETYKLSTSWNATFLIHTHTQNCDFFLNFTYLRILLYLPSLTMLISSHYILAPIYSQQKLTKEHYQESEGQILVLTLPFGYFTSFLSLFP